MKIISLATARTTGLARYFTGVACKRGHVAERFTSTRHCVACANAASSKWKKSHRLQATTASRIWNAANRERSRAFKNAWSKANPESQKARSRKWYEANKDKSFEASRHWRARNKDKVASAVEAWRKANPHKVNAHAAWRRAEKANRTPAWADHEKIEAIYARARDLSATTGLEYHVDHVIPLHGEFVSGLHVETNLQILAAQLNRSKSNRFEPVSLAH